MCTSSTCEFQVSCPSNPHVQRFEARKRSMWHCHFCYRPRWKRSLLCLARWVESASAATRKLLRLLAPVDTSSVNVSNIVCLVQWFAGGICIPWWCFNYTVNLVSFCSLSYKESNVPGLRARQSRLTDNTVACVATMFIWSVAFPPVYKLCVYVYNNY